MAKASPFIDQTERRERRYYTHVKKYNIFSSVLLRLFSGLEILVEHHSLYDKYGFQAARQPIYDNFGSTDSFWDQYFSVNQRDLRERKED